MLPLPHHKILFYWNLLLKRSVVLIIYSPSESTTCIIKTHLKHSNIDNNHIFFLVNTLVSLILTPFSSLKFFLVQNRESVGTINIMAQCWVY